MKISPSRPLLVTARGPAPPRCVLPDRGDIAEIARIARQWVNELTIEYTAADGEQRELRLFRGGWLDTRRP